jgi:3-oxoacyl-[acyl-carrier protein] reductase
MDLQLADKVVWITGASGGIGRALAEALAAEGALLALAGRRHTRELYEWLALQGWRERALVVEGDVGSRAAMLAAVDAIVARFGRIDVCAANAGLWPSEGRRLDELSDERLRATLEVNLIGALNTAAAFFAGLRRTGPRADHHGAALAFTGSTAGRFGEQGHADYAAAKSALAGATLSLKNEIVELDPYGRVNLVEPGWTVTHMARPALQEPGMIERATSTMALAQLARAKDVARTIVWLSSHAAARHVTGQVITVAGGMEGRLLRRPEAVARDDVLRRLAED